MNTNRRRNKFIQSQEIFKNNILQTRKQSLNNDMFYFLETNDVTSSSRISRQSSLLQKEQNIIKRKRQKMEILIMKYQQQRKCIQELQEYIDELQGEIIQKTKTNELLTSEKQMLQQKLLANQKILHGFGANNQKDIESMTRLMSDQIYLFENQRRKWQCQLKMKSQQFKLEKELLQQKSHKLKEEYLLMVQKIQHKMIQKQNDLYQRIGKLEMQVQILQQENKQMKTKSKASDELDKILSYRKELEQKKQISQKQTNDNSILIEQLNDLSSELKKLKKNCYNLECQLEAKEFQLQCKEKQIQAKNMLINEIQQKRRKQNLSHYQQQQQLKQLLHQKQLKWFQLMTQHQQKENKLEVQFQSLKTKASTHRQQNDRSLRLKQLRKREYKQLQKMNSIFDKLNIQ